MNPAPQMSAMATSGDGIEIPFWYKGVATLLRFSECQGIIVAANMRDLKKLCRGFYLADFDPKKAKPCLVAKRK